MTHRSRICAVGIDTDPERYEATATFWSAALGRSPAEEDPYTNLPGPDVDYFVQRIEEGSPRVHLDVETDDVLAEVARLEEHGAQRVRQVESWWLMEDPGGHVFCVVPVQSRVWPSGVIEWS
ncbi:MAG: VOC family protein [Acidobacteria bacterium]|nr:VOC family protein [Acidobacteriota bacterium]